MRHKFRKGRLYWVRFYDHALLSAVESEEVICEIVGWVVKQTKASVTFSFWRVANRKEDEIDGHEPFNIIKSTVIDSVDISIKDVLDIRKLLNDEKESDKKEIP